MLSWLNDSLPSLKDCKYLQARSQDLEKGGGGGLFWKSEKCANNLDPNFHCSWISFTGFARNLRRNFSETSETQSAQNQVVSKKKKKVFTDFETDFRPKSKIHTFFPPNFRWSPKKIGKSNVWEGAVFRWGGRLFSIFHQKSASKAPKTCDFAYFTSQWGAVAPPPAPPGYATKYL